jgi:hypothetical protein
MKEKIIQKKLYLHSVFLLLLTGLIFTLLFIGYPVFSDENGGDVHGKPLEDVLEEIREKQGLGQDDPIDARKVSDQDLEELGEAVMSVMIPDPEQHEVMDTMMGGEGSRRLARMHRRMGYSYLTGRGHGMCGMFGKRGGKSGGMMM